MDAASNGAGVLFVELARLSLALKGTTSRLTSMERVGSFLRRLEGAEIRPAVLMLLGRVTPFGAKPLEVSGAALGRVLRQLGGGRGGQGEDFGASIRAALEASETFAFASEPTLGLREVHERLLGMVGERGKGSSERRIAVLVDLFRRCTADEAEVLARIVLRDMRQGANEGLLLEALARAVDVPRDRVSRAQMLVGDLSEVARIALLEGEAGIEAVAFAHFRPLKPMLAQKAENVAEALDLCGGRASLEYKMDGARLQIHRRGEQVRLFSRRLSEVTPSLPDVVSFVRSQVGLDDFIAEGELVPVDASGRPVAFQELMRRFRRVHDVEALAAEVPVRLYLFDLLASRGAELIDAPLSERWEQLAAAVSESEQVVLVPRLVTSDAVEGEAFYVDAVARGYEGVMAKDLRSAYTPGVRGRAWLKIKVAHTLDVVVVGADWGYGRRSGWLSNYHLAVRGPSGELLEVGKTFKGLTDAEFVAMTSRLLALQSAEQRGSTVPVTPDVVLEVAFSDIQKSPQYACGYALRFARVVRIRDDKGPGDIDTIAAVEAQYARQLGAEF